jgi:hypothetical protein
MPLIRVACGVCHAALQVRAELAPREGRCPKCGAAISLPASGVCPETLPLGYALAPDILAEISRRKQSAVLVVFDTPAQGAYALSRQAGANVCCYRTGDMGDAQLALVLGELARMTPGAKNAKGGTMLTPLQPELPLDFKGDRLGMTLPEFKARHARTVGKFVLPYASDFTPGQANTSLWSEAWHAAAGIVHARVDLPSENNSPSVAGVKTELFIYQFVDGLLFRMTGLFDTEAFSLVRKGFTDKHGAPSKELQDPVELVWENGVLAIHLVRGTMRPKRSSMIVYTHKELQATADQRAPRRGADL